jgi:glycosyltransferase involved in cell wall biosynthesis
MDSVKNPHTGYLVEYGNVEEFAEKILHVLQNTQKRDDLSQQAIQWSQKFDWDKSATKSLKILLT